MSEFSQYRVFVAVVETGGISSAARLLNHTPSAISKQISTLENCVKVRLVERSNRYVKITDAGKTFYQRCKTILAAVAEAESQLHSNNEQLSGKLSITLSKSLARSSLFGCLAQFSATHPAIRYHIEMSDEVQNLVDHNIDFAFRLGKIPDSSHLVALPLFEVQLLFCATPQYLQKQGCPTSYKELAAHTLIVLSPYYYSEAMRRFFKKEKIDLDETRNHSTNDIEAVYQSIMAHQCIGMMLDVSIQTELNQQRVVNLFANSKPPSKRLYLVYKKTPRPSKKHKIFKQFIREHLKQPLTQPSII